jgi:hypothetical protein
MRDVRGITAIAFVTALTFCASATAAPAVSCTAPSTVTVSGTIQKLQSMREEPQAEVQTFFDLVLDSPLCGKQHLNASVTGLIPCANGDTITMTGEFSPPDKMFDMAFLRGQRSVDCRRR